MIWGQVCESDEIYSTNTRKWYRVLQVQATLTTATIQLEKVGKPLVRPACQEIPPDQIRRGETGQAMDVFITIFSGEKRA